MNENINGNHDLQDNNKKLIFDSNLDLDINLRYIQDWNNAFASNPNFDDEKQVYTKPMARIIFVDLKKMSQKISDGDYKESKNNYGVISEDFMSSLMYEWFYFTDCENILWEILNAGKNFTNVNSENIAEVDLYDQLNETRDSRIEKLMKTNFGDRIIENDNYDASDIEDCYFEYANSKYADRYFFYFSMLRNLSRYTFKRTNEEYEKYNVENIKKVQLEIKTNQLSTCKFQEHVNEAELATNVMSSDIYALKDKNDEKSINDSEKLNSDLMVKSQLVTNTNQKINQYQE